MSKLIHEDVFREVAAGALLASGLTGFRDAVREAAPALVHRAAVDAKYAAALEARLCDLLMESYKRPFAGNSEGEVELAVLFAAFVDERAGFEKTLVEGAVASAVGCGTARVAGLAKSIFDERHGQRFNSIYELEKLCPCPEPKDIMYDGHAGECSTCGGVILELHPSCPAAVAVLVKRLRTR